TDVPVSHPFCKEIAWAAGAGITTGFVDGSFRPAAPVSRQAAAAFLTRFADETVPACPAAPFPDVPVSPPFCKGPAWAAGAGIPTGFVDGSFRPAAPVSRQAAAAFLSRLGVQIAAA